MTPQTTEPTPLPPPTEDGETIAALLEAFIEYLPRKDRLPFLESVSRAHERRVATARVTRIRDAPFDQAVLAARVGAARRWPIIAERAAAAVK